MLPPQKRFSPTWPPRRPRAFLPGYTLVELLTTVAMLVVIFGLMISLAHHLRRESTNEVTRDILHRLSQAMATYYAQNHNQPPAAPELLPANRLEAPEAALQDAALANNRAFVAVLRDAHLMSGRFDDLSIAYYDADTIRDAWGGPIVFMPHLHPAIGMTAQGWFFFSAGPDRKFLTREDNLYSYDQ